MAACFPALIALTLAWGAFAFGAVYDWAYVPLASASGALGVLGLVMRGGRAKAVVDVPVAAGLGIVLLATALQLVPIRVATIQRISPATDRFLATYDVGYAVAVTETGTAAVGSGRAGEALPHRQYRHPLSVNPPATWLGVGCLSVFGVLLLGTARALGRQSLPRLGVGVTAVGLALGLAGIVQSGLTRNAALAPMIYGFWQPQNDGAVPFGPFINRNHFAGWMLLALPVAIGYFCGLVARGMRGVTPTFRDRVLWFSSRDASRVGLVGLAAAVMALSLVLTLSRSGIAAFLAAIAVYAAFVVRRQARGSKRRLLLVCIAVLVVLSIGWAGLDGVVGRFSSASSDFFAGRKIAWGDAWRIVKDFPLVGTGLNTFGYATLFYETPGLPRHYVEAHNDYLQLLAEGGGLLAVPAVLSIFLFAREIRRRFKEGLDDTMTYWLRVGATSGLIAIALQEIVEFSLQIPGIAALFAVVGAIAIHRPERRRDPDAPGTRSEAKPSTREHATGDD